MLEVPTAGIIARP